MTTTDSERIAPVTYLFGATITGINTEEPVSEIPSPSVHTLSSSSTPAPREARTTNNGKFERVSNVSMHALARRGMSSREMHDYLVGREFDDAEVAEEVARLEGVGLINDEELAQTLVRTLRDRKGLGRSALTAELRRRHLDASAIDEALDGGRDGSGDDELQRATELAVRRAPQLRSLDSTTAKRRLGAFLMRKGYSGSVVGAAVAAALESSGPTFR